LDYEKTLGLLCGASGPSGFEESAVRTAAELLRLNKAWTLNLYAVMDMGVHYYGWSLYDLYEFLASCGINDMEAAKEIFSSIIEEPANYLRYYAGYLEFEALKDRAVSALGGNFDPAEYHHALLSLGPAPFYLLEKEIDVYIASKD